MEQMWSSLARWSIGRWEPVEEEVVPVAEGGEGPVGGLVG